MSARWAIFSLVIVLSMANNESFGQRTKNFSRNFLPMWERATEYTLILAEEMPQGLYQFRPDSSVMTFGQHLSHIAQNLYWLNSTYIVDEESPLEGDDFDYLPKEEVIELLENAFKYVSQTINGMTDEEVAQRVSFGGENVDKERILYLMRDHMTHHRAQVVIYMRLNGMKPPRYVGW